MAAVAAAAEGAGDNHEPPKERMMRPKLSSAISSRALCTFLMSVLACGFSVDVFAQAPSAVVGPKQFDTPQQAAAALIEAARKSDIPGVLEIFGPEGKELVSSADPVQDKNQMASFAAKASEKKAVVVDPKDKSRAILSVGNDDWPLPVPIVKKSGKWYFDAVEGRDELLMRRIGANELDAIQVCRGFVEAQHEYAAEIRGESGTAQYAQKMISTPGKRDGLYWVNKDGTPGGPISAAVAKAIQEGYTLATPDYHGYYFRVLKGQGPAAPMGELDYMVKGLMIGGFALVAAPSEYGVTGLKTFMVSYDGVVYEKDLGNDSLKIVKAMERFNPDKTWTVTDDEWPPDDSVAGAP